MIRSLVLCATVVAGVVSGQQSPGYLTPESQMALGVVPPSTPVARAGLPKAAARASVQDPQRSSLPPEVRIDKNGWPVLQPRSSRGGESVISDFDRPAPLAETRPNAGPGTDVPSAAGVPQPFEGSRTLPVATGESPLADVFAVVGSPVRARTLAGVRAEVRTELLDSRGAVIGGERSTLHTADFGEPHRDRVTFARGIVYGRTEYAPFAERGDLPWPSLDDEAARYLDIHGLLLRFPWAFANRDEFSVMPAERSDDNGRPVLIIRAERESPALGAANQPLGARPVGPADPSTVDRFELRCSVDPLIPEELRYTLGATGVTRRVRLLDWRPIPGMGVQIPHRREFLDENGQPRMVVRIDRLQVGLDLQLDAFRPR